VNVSASLAAERVRRSRIGGVEKAAALLRTHEADMASFLSADPAGRELPKYLGTLAACLASEQKETLRELEELAKNVEHIKTIVGMQQAHAKGAGVREMEDVEALAEDALRVCAMELERHGVPVERRYEPAPRVLVDRHQVLQILINLIRNAKQAVSATPHPRRPVVVRVGPDGAGGVRVSVEDRGVGIAPENLTRIFQHGFTTKAGGHGFGLHSAALAAKNMGASLTVESEGPGRGAAFTLAFPALRAGVAA
jgi:two-component system, NtrC family, sensor kinase